MSPPTTCCQSSRTKRNTLGVTPTSPPLIVVREREEESKDVRETTLWRRGKPLNRKQYPGESKVDDRKHPPGGGNGSSAHGEESNDDCVGGGGGGLCIGVGSNGIAGCWNILLGGPLTKLIPAHQM